MSSQKFVSATTKDGVVVNTDTDVMAVGDDVYTLDASGAKVPLADGSYDFDNGISIDVVSGKITELADTKSDAQEEGLDKESVDIIQKAIEPIIAEMKKNFEEKLAALKVELTNQAAGTSPIKKVDPAPVALSSIEKVKQLLTKKTK